MIGWGWFRLPSSEAPGWRWLGKFQRKKEHPGEHATWTLALNGGRADSHYNLKSNAVSTTRYTPLTFIPAFLVSYFSRAAYLYFLLQAGLAYWTTISPFSPAGPTAALVFVLLVAAVKEIVEDTRRAKEDRRVNTAETTVIQPDGTEKRVPWTDVKMGHLVRVRDKEFSPADMVILDSALPERTCFVRTTNLDGETNLKIRRCVDLGALHAPLASGLVSDAAPLAVGHGGQGHRRGASAASLPAPEDSPEGRLAVLMRRRAMVEYETPRAELHVFHGQMRRGLPMDHDRAAGGARGHGHGHARRSIQLPGPLGRVSAAVRRASGTSAGLGPDGAHGAALDVDIDAELEDLGAAHEHAGAIPVSINEVLLRGMELRNTGSVVGLVMYVGSDTRIQQNSRPIKAKLGAYDRFLNLQISLVILLQLVLCAVFAAVGLVWRNTEGEERYFLGLTEGNLPGGRDPYSEGNYSSNFVQWIVNFFSYWILLSYLVPISLFVTMEIVRGIMGLIYLNRDDQMKDPDTGEYGRARNTGVIESLGKVTHAFCDKTGTLTQNEMHLRMIAIRHNRYGSHTVRLETMTGPPMGEDARMLFDTRLQAAVEKLEGLLARLGMTPWELVSLPDSAWSDSAAAAPAAPAARGSAPRRLSGLPPQDRCDAAQARDLVLFFLSLACGHELLVDQSVTLDGKLPGYTGASPDEIALVSALASFGFVFLGRSHEGIEVDLMGHRGRVAIPQVLEFSGDRRRMSVVAVLPTGATWLFIKGADSVMIDMAADEGPDPAFGPEPGAAPGTPRPDIIESSLQHLHVFATLGLRTLVVGAKRLDPEAYLPWVRAWNEASTVLGPARAARRDALSDEIERGIRILGVVGVEDKLQDGVPEAIRTMLDAGIRVWVITGDKRETAANIALSCGLFRSLDSIIHLEAGSPKECREALQALQEGRAPRRHRVSREFTPPGGGPAGSDGEGPSASPGSASGPGRQVFSDPGATGSPAIKGVDKSFLSRGGMSGSGAFGAASDLVIDGGTLRHILSDTLLSWQFASVAEVCPAVVVCRASPYQKAEIVRLIREFELEKAANGGVAGAQPFEFDSGSAGAGASGAGPGKGCAGWAARLRKWNPVRWWTLARRALAQHDYKTTSKLLAVGDGANDVSMIQAADVGVGVFGKEGRQAVNASDFAVPQFRFLVRLLLVHGTWSDYRLAKLIKYSYYKNVGFGCMLWLYNFFNGYSAQALVDTWSTAMYNAILTALPIGVLALTTRPTARPETLLAFPQAYNRGSSLTKASFWKSFLEGCFDGATCFLLSYFSSTGHGRHTTNNVYAIGKTAFISLLGSVSVEISLITRVWTWLLFWVTLISFAFGFVILVIIPYIEKLFGATDLNNYNLFIELFQSGQFWMCILAAMSVVFVRRFLWLTFQWLFRPTDTMLLMEKEAIGPSLEAGLGWQGQTRLARLSPGPGGGGGGAHVPHSHDPSRSPSSDSNQPGYSPATPPPPRAARDVMQGRRSRNGTEHSERPLLGSPASPVSHYHSPGTPPLSLSTMSYNEGPGTRQGSPGHGSPMSSPSSVGASNATSPDLAQRPYAYPSPEDLGFDSGRTARVPARAVDEITPVVAAQETAMARKSLGGRDSRDGRVPSRSARQGRSFGSSITEPGYSGGLPLAGAPPSHVLYKPGPDLIAQQRAPGTMLAQLDYMAEQAQGYPDHGQGSLAYVAGAAAGPTGSQTPAPAPISLNPNPLFGTRTPNESPAVPGHLSGLPVGQRPPPQVQGQWQGQWQGQSTPSLLGPGRLAIPSSSAYAAPPASPYPDWAVTPPAEGLASMPNAPKKKGSGTGMAPAEGTSAAGSESQSIIGQPYNFGNAPALSDAGPWSRRSSSSSQLQALGAAARPPESGAGPMATREWEAGGVGGGGAGRESAGVGGVRGSGGYGARRGLQLEGEQEGAQ